MLRLLRIEWTKIARYPGFWLILILSLGIYIGAVSVMGHPDFEFPDSTKPQVEGFLSFPMIWDIIGWLSYWFNLPLAIVVVLNISNEFSQRMLRQAIINGQSREEWMAGKIVFIALISFLALLVVIATTTFTGIYFGGIKRYYFFDHLDLFFGVWLRTFSYLSLVMLISTLIRKPVIALGFVILYGAIIENILVATGNSPWNEWYPLWSAVLLVPNPFAAFYGDSVPKLLDGEVLFRVIGYTATWLGLTYLFIRRRDL